MRNLHFFYLLLSCTENQARALLETADKEQVTDVINVIYNITLNSSLLTTQAKKLISTQKKLISKLTDKNNSDKKKYSIIRNNSSKVHKILLSAKKSLVKALK